MTVQWVLILQEYLVFDGVSMQTLSADGQHTSFESLTVSFNRFIFIDEFNSVVGWMHGETELRVSNSWWYVSVIELIVPKLVLTITSSESIQNVVTVLKN